MIMIFLSVEIVETEMCVHAGESDVLYLRW